MRALMLAVGAERYAVELGAVREVIETAVVVTVPSRHRHVHGVLNVRGEVVPALDTGTLLGLGPVASHGAEVGWWAIVDHAGDACALAASACPQIVTLGTPVAGARLPAVRDRYLHEETAVALLDLGALLADPATPAAA